MCGGKGGGGEGGRGKEGRGGGVVIDRQSSDPSGGWGIPVVSLTCCRIPNRRDLFDDGFLAYQSHPMH